ncbi:hypothetical protein RJ639_008217 [Escallonia herrerae]|uniref:DNA replication complex GINS protein PSF2 n=1 Tax=Escallonia herrerae TaxID=1293975 RepID=A0AA88VSV4_9ASTE|nr:hypothetical protein RJ639_008217 [Escallonia herrerae]
MAGQSDPSGSTFTAAELEFLAEDETVEIVPNMRMDTLDFICGQYEKLTQVLEAERDSLDLFQPLPFHYVEISRLLFDHARDDIPDVYLVRSLIEDIKDVRFHKIGTGMEKLAGRASAIVLKHISAMEVNIVRPFTARALETFYKLDSPEMLPDSERGAVKHSQVADHGQRRPLRPNR